MISPPGGVLIWLVAGFTDLRKGLDGLSALVQSRLHENPFSGSLYIFRGRRGDKIKVLWYSRDGLCLFYKRLSDGKFVWPQVMEGTVAMSAAQLAMLLEGIDWRRPKRTAPSPQDPDRTHPTST
jgi:transposase